MVVATFLNRERREAPRYSVEPDRPQADSIDWVKLAACGSLIAGGLMLLSGQRKAGLVVAASGTALALLNHEDALRQLWDALPGYVDRAQWMIGQAQEVVDDITSKGESLRRVLSR
jgi:hypothetical protein